MSDNIALKFGGLKRWECDSPLVINLINMYHKVDYNIAEYEETRKHLLCLIIDLADCDTIYMDFDDKYVSKRKSKEYVMEYLH